jgi:hypothetical protein
VYETVVGVGRVVVSIFGARLESGVDSRAVCIRRNLCVDVVFLCIEEDVIEC